MTELNEQLIQATKASSLAEMERLVAAGAEVNVRGRHAPLVWAAEQGSAEKTLWLLDRGAEVDGNDGSTRLTALMSAAYRGSEDVVTVLLQHGADPDRTDNQGRSAKSLAKERSHPGTLAILENPPKLQPPSPDEVSFSYKLDNRVLQEIFCFPRKERVTLIRRSETGQVEAVTRETFADLSDRGALRKAFDEHRSRGGTTPEDEIFPDSLGKPARLKL